MEDSPATSINAIPTSERDIASGDPSVIAWITFSGLPGKSPTKFIQSVQRVGFSQGKVRDDGWLAGFVTTCFEGDALSWYSDLDAETQTSWAKLKIELLRRYGPSAGRLSSTSMLKPGIGNKPVTQSSSPPLPSQDFGTAGCIEVVVARAVTLGYLSYDKTVGINITTDQDKALILALPTGKLSAPMHLYMSDLPAGQSFPYLGLALLPADKSKTRSAIPAAIKDTYQFQSPPYTYNSFSSHPKPPPSVLIRSCQSQDIPPPQYRSGGSSPKRVYLASWKFSPCKRSRTGDPYRRRSDTESPDQRGIAEVWKYDPRTEELTLSVMDDDGTECEMGACMHGGTSSQLCVHRSSDMEGLGRCGDHVRFVFQPW